MKKFILEVYLNADEFQKAFICVLIYLSTCTVSKKKKATRSQKLQHYVNWINKKKSNIIKHEY